MKFLFGLLSGGGGSDNGETSQGETSVGGDGSSDDGGVVDDVLGGVVGHVLLDGRTDGGRRTAEGQTDVEVEIVI